MVESHKERNPNWTEDEVKMAINIYCKIPFKSTRKTSPEIIHWAKVIGRSPGGLYTKLCNLGRCDKAMHDIGVKGLSHGGKLEPILWAEFERNPERIIFESEQLLAERMGTTVEVINDLDALSLPEGRTREAVVRQRVNQKFFRDMVLNAYDRHCCVTGITSQSLLEACHISSWNADEKNRTNPKNGLCMTSTFHRAYDKFLMAITPDHEIVISEQLLGSAQDEHTRRFLAGLQHKKMLMPEKFAPDVELLALHYELYRKAAI
jgi:putative restriction endonuclease